MGTLTKADQIAIVTKRRLSDRIFRSILIFGGTTSFFVLLAIFLYLVQRSMPVLREFGIGFVTNSIWYSGDGFPASQGSTDPAVFGLFPMAYGTLLIRINSDGHCCSHISHACFGYFLLHAKENRFGCDICR